MKRLSILLATVTLLGALTGAAGAATARPSAVTGAVTSVSPTSATATGTVNPNGTATTYQFQYGLASAATYTNATPLRSAGSGTRDVAVSVPLRSLSPGTSYRYRIIAMSATGKTEGAAGVFNTTATPTALTDAAGQVSDTAATLNGIVNPEGSATTWYFQYGRSLSYGTRTASHAIGPSSNSTNVTATITGLSPATTYHFRLVAASSAGTARGVDFTFTTGLPVTINASSTSVVYGGKVTLSGTVTSGSTGVDVTIEQQPYGQGTFSGLTVVTTTVGGAWSYTVSPSLRTTYVAVLDQVASSPVVVGVRPAVSIAVLRSGRVATRVVAAMPFGEHVLQLQRLSKGVWVTWKHVRLNARGADRFATSLPKGRTPIRMAIGPFVPGPDQAGPGYLAGYSKVAYYRH